MSRATLVASPPGSLYWQFVAAGQPDSARPVDAGEPLIGRAVVTLPSASVPVGLGDHRVVRAFGPVWPATPRRPDLPAGYQRRGRTQ